MVFLKNPSYNRSTFFVLPVVNFPREFFKSYLLNTYLYIDQEAISPGIKIYILVQNDNKSLIGVIKLRNTIERVFELGGDYKGSSLIECIIPRQFYGDIDKFVKGQYSQFSEEYKELIKRYYRMASINPASKRFEISTTYKILYPTQADRNLWAEALGCKLEDNAEIFSIPSKDEETFKFEE